jgi:MoaA/NifB/PqqE/SkfB family radical SAM enzyme
MTNGSVGPIDEIRARVLRSWPRLPVVPVKPLTVQVEVTSRCNLACVMCARTYHLGSHGVHMTRQTFDAVLRAFSSARAIHMQGWGEPLMHPLLFDFIAAAEPRRRIITTNTNLTVLTDRMVERVLASDLSALRVSLDGATSETYERLRPPARWDRVLRNLSRLLEARRAAGADRPEVTLVVVCQEDSVGELPDLVRMTAELGLNELRVQELRTFGSSTSAGPADVDQAKARCLELAATAGLRLDWSFYSDYAQPVCPWPWNKVYVRATGRISLCCEKVFQETPEDTFGDVNSDGGWRIWNGRRYRAARRDLASGGWPAACGGCPIYHFPAPNDG